MIIISFVINIKSSGENWSSIEVIRITNEYPTSLIVKIDKMNTIHVIYEAEQCSGGIIYYINKPFGGRWGVLESISNGENPTMTVDSHCTIHVVLRKKISNPNDSYQLLYMNKSYNGNWSDIPTIIDCEKFLDKASIAVDTKDMVHVVWNDLYYNTYLLDYTYGIFYSIQINNSEWMKPKLMTEILHEPINYCCDSPCIALDSEDCIHVAWQDKSNYMGSNDPPEIQDYDIFYYCPSNRGSVPYVSDVRGGWGVRVIVKNIGNVEAKNLNWNIDIIPSGKSRKGSISIIQINQSVKLRNQFIGFGWNSIDIIVHAGPSVAAYNGYQIGPFVLIGKRWSSTE